MKQNARNATLVWLAGGVFLLITGSSIWAAGRSEYPIVVILILALAVFFLLAGATKIQPGWPVRVEQASQRICAWLSVSEAQLAALALSPALSLTVWLAAGKADLMTFPLIAWLAWALALTAAVFGGFEQASSVPLSRKTLISLAGVFLLALLPRILFSETIPIFLSGDEGSAGIAAARMANGQVNNLFRLDWYSFPTFYFSIPALSIRLFGQTLTALRVPAAIGGALTVVAVFALAQTAFGARAGWFAAIFLTFSHFHNHFSRIALNNIWDGLWFTVVCGALWYGLERNRRNAFMLAGLTLGLSQYFYTSGRGLLVVVILWMIFLAVRNPARLRARLPDLTLMWLTAWVTALPLVFFEIQFPNEFAAPFNRVTILGKWMTVTMQSSGLPAWHILLDQLWLGFGGFAWVPIRHWYTPGAPILLPSSAIFFALGLIFLLWKRDSFRLPLLLWLAAYGLMGSLSESAPASQRYPGAAPAAALLIGYGLENSLRLLTRFFPAGEKAFHWLGVLIILLLAGVEGEFYFFKYTPQSALRLTHTNSMIGDRMGHYLAQQPPDTQVLFLGGPYMSFKSIPSTQYYAPAITGIDINFPWGDPQNPPIPTGKILFIILPYNQDQIALIMRAYPNGRLTDQMDNDDSPLFYIYDPNPDNP